MKKIAFLFLILVAVFAEPIFAAQTSDKLTLRLVTLEQGVDPELIALSADILSKRFSYRNILDVGIKISGGNELEIYAEADQVGDILLLVFKRGLLEFVDFSGLGVNMPREGDCILTNVQMEQISPTCAPAEGETERREPQPRLDGTPYTTVMTGKGLDDAQAVSAGTEVNQWVISFTLNEEGNGIFAEFTGSHIGQPMAIVLDGIVISTPTIAARISGSGQIAGNFTKGEAENLAAVLKFGMLPVSFVVVGVSEYKGGR